MTRLEALIVWAAIAAPMITVLLVLVGNLPAAIMFVLAVVFCALEVVK